MIENVELKTLLEFITVIIALLTFCKGVCEYSDYLKRKRIQYLLDFGRKYTEDKDIGEVIVFLEHLEDDNQYKCIQMKDGSYDEDVISIHKIEMFMRFIEELELLIRVNSISESAALNLFGHYTTILDKYYSRWPKLGYEKKYWNVFRSFVEKAKKFDYNSISV